MDLSRPYTSADRDLPQEKKYYGASGQNLFKVKAHDEYIGIAIFGNAAWPTLESLVGIRARGGREKISKGNIAHAMDDEMTLKYLTSIKRLVSYAQC